MIKMERLTIHNIGDNYSLWKKILEAEYTLLGLADDVFVSPVRYYFNHKGFGLISSKDTLIVLGDNKDRIKREIIRLEKKIKTRVQCSTKK
jgi:hypothetical protein